MPNLSIPATGRYSEHQKTLQEISSSIKASIHQFHDRVPLSLAVITNSLSIGRGKTIIVPSSALAQGNQASSKLVPSHVNDDQPIKSHCIGDFNKSNHVPERLSYRVFNGGDFTARSRWNLRIHPR